MNILLDLFLTFAKIGLFTFGGGYAMIRGLKPCVIGIVLATGIYMVISNCFGSVSALSANFQAIIITAILVALMLGYKHFKKKNLSPILLIVLSAATGIIVYGM